MIIFILEMNVLKCNAKCNALLPVSTHFFFRLFLTKQYSTVKKILVLSKKCNMQQFGKFYGLRLAVV